MKLNNDSHRFDGILGYSGNKEVFLGFAPADVLCSISFADVLDEGSGKGYQRPPSVAHSKDFKNYIAGQEATTIPLTFNLRPNRRSCWHLIRRTGNRATLFVKQGSSSMAQVDCQHRLAELANIQILFPFMTFIGLDLRSEMAIFYIINSKAKGLSSSLTDYHQSSLLTNIIEEAPHLYIARKLNEDLQSPWHGFVKFGGKDTSGLRRRTSLRMLQKSIRKFLLRSNERLPTDIASRYEIIRTFWVSVSKVFSKEWQDHRHSLLSKGIGLYSLMALLSDLVTDDCTMTSDPVGYFTAKLMPLAQKIDWHSKGMFSPFGGQKGANDVYAILRKAAGL